VKIKGKKFQRSRENILQFKPVTSSMCEVSSPIYLTYEVRVPRKTEEKTNGKGCNEREVSRWKNVRSGSVGNIEQEKRGSKGNVCGGKRFESCPPVNRGECFVTCKKVVARGSHGEGSQKK